MADETYPSFDESRIQQSIEAARTHAESHRAELMASNDMSITADNGALLIAAQCISVTVQNGKVCLNLPLGIGSVCLPVPSWIPNGTAAQACINICTKWGIPCGVEVTVSVAGQQIIKKGFGCSC